MKTMLGDLSPRIRSSFAKFMSAAQIAAVNRTNRAGIVGGDRAVVPKLVMSMATPSDTILDFGAGRNALHTQEMRRRGLKVTPFEVGANFQPGMHDQHALNKRYTIVFASNVLNVAPTPETLKATVRDLMGAVATGGVAVVNYPQRPRKTEVSAQEVEALLGRFGQVERVGASVWKVRKN